MRKKMALNRPPVVGEVWDALANPDHGSDQREWFPRVCVELIPFTEKGVAYTKAGFRPLALSEGGSDRRAKPSSVRLDKFYPNAYRFTGYTLEEYKKRFTADAVQRDVDQVADTPTPEPQEPQASEPQEPQASEPQEPQASEPQEPQASEQVAAPSRGDLVHALDVALNVHMQELGDRLELAIDSMANRIVTELQRVRSGVFHTRDAVLGGRTNAGEAPPIVKAFGRKVPANLMTPRTTPRAFILWASKTAQGVKMGTDERGEERLIETIRRAKSAKGIPVLDQLLDAQIPAEVRRALRLKLQPPAETAATTITAATDAKANDATIG